VEGSCEHGNEPSGSIKCWEVLEWLHNCQLLKKGSVSIKANPDLTVDDKRSTNHLMQPGTGNSSLCIYSCGLEMDMICLVWDIFKVFIKIVILSI
jgi:hypothetical protein